MKRKQVRSACSNCRFKHARCDNERPCGGCVKAGLAESCVDAPRKQRKHNDDHSVSSNGAYNYLTLFDVRDSKPAEVWCSVISFSQPQKSSLYSLSSFTAPADSLVRISNFSEDPVPKITTLDTNKIYDASVPTGSLLAFCELTVIQTCRCLLVHQTSHIILMNLQWGCPINVFSSCALVLQYRVANARKQLSSSTATKLSSNGWYAPNAWYASRDEWHAPWNEWYVLL